MTGIIQPHTELKLDAFKQKDVHLYFWNSFLDLFLIKLLPIKTKIRDFITFDLILSSFQELQQMADVGYFHHDFHNKYNLKKILQKSENVS